MRALRSEPVASEEPPSRWRRLATIDRRLLVLLLCAPLPGLVGVVAADLVPKDRPLTPWVVLGSVAALGVVALVSVARRRQLSGRRGLVICALIALAPAVAWYVALNNHSQIHPQLV